MEIINFVTKKRDEARNLSPVLESGSSKELFNRGEIYAYNQVLIELEKNVENKGKVTIAELERILKSEGEENVDILPNGEVEVNHNP